MKLRTFRTVALSSTFLSLLICSAFAQNPRRVPPVSGQSPDPATASSDSPGKRAPSRAPAARLSKTSVAPGTYRDWHDIDEVTIVRTFDPSAYDQIAVESFDTSGVQLPPADDNTFRAVQSALRLMKPAFIDGLERKAQRKAAATRSGRTLVVRGRLLKVDPGSQAARYFVGFGAGAVKIQMAGELVDGSSGATLVRFMQERRSGFGAFGGGYNDLFQRTARQLGGDVAGLLNSF